MNKSNQSNKKSRRSEYGQVLKRVLVIFLNTRGEKALRPIEIVRRAPTPINYNSVRTAIRYLYKKGILEKRGRGFYRLIDFNKAREELERLKHNDVRKLIYLGGVPRSHGDGRRELKAYFRQFLDLEAAIFEHGMVKFRVDHWVADRLRGDLESRSRDRARQVSYATGSFSIVISKHGSVRLYLKNPKTWLKDFIKFLEERGLDEYNVKYVLQQVINAIPEARVSVEIPVTNESIPTEITIETKVGDKVLISRITGSHFPQELEINGNLPLVDNFIAALAAVQHFSVLEFIQANELTEINQKFGILSKGLEELAKQLRIMAETKVKLRYQNDTSTRKELGGNIDYIV